jgi:enamine deaminase RidA (YjgF/YER057c/UK114 family)
MAGRQRITLGGAFEERAGYSRAVRVGDTVYVAGTAALQDGKPVAPGDAAAQTRHILGIIERALTQAGATIDEVVRYRVFVTSVADWPAVAAELGHTFSEIRPAGTLVVVAALVDPGLVVEIEVDAVIGSAG